MAGRFAIRRLGLIVAAVIFAADLLSKPILLDLMAANPGGIRVTPFFNLVMVWNRGVSFGLLSGDAPMRVLLLVALALGIIVWLGFWLWRTPYRFTAAALGLVIGGAFGNIVDRLRFGAVADFFDFHFAGWHWPAFNIADSSIVIGVALLVLDSLRAKV